jgi:hypothetical protein
MMTDGTKNQATRLINRLGDTGFFEDDCAEMQSLIDEIEAIQRRRDRHERNALLSLRLSLVFGVISFVSAMLAMVLSIA